MRKKRNLLIAVASLLAVVVMVTGTLFVTHSAAHAGASSKGFTFEHLKLVHSTTVGRSVIHPNTTSNDPTGAKNEYRQDDQADSPKVPNGNGNSGSVPTTAPNPNAYPVTSANDQFSGFNGVSHADQRLAGTGVYANTQFSLEPPDQGLCAGNGFVIDAVNNAMAIYDNNGNLLSGPTAMSQFFGFAPEIDRTTGVTGPFISDPKCYYDWQTNRWFLSELEQDNGTNAGATGRNYNVLAVSQTADPTGGWAIFTYDVTDDGLNGTPAHGGCPCFGDQPLIGTDKYGVYTTTNEFGATTFNGAQIYVISKAQIEAAAASNSPLPPVVHINAADDLAPYGGLSYSIQPAERAAGDYDQTDRANQEQFHGIEYFLSALQFGPAPLDNRIAAWAITNTKSLDSNNVDISLQFQVISSEVYGQPPNATQKPGPTPLRSYLQKPNPYCAVNGTPAPCPASPLEQLASNDDRMNQVTFSHNSLLSAVNTVVQVPGQNPRVGVAWFDVIPSWPHGSFRAYVHRQGYVSVAGENVLFPAIAVNSHGTGVLGVTLVGPHRFPSTAYVRIDVFNGAYGPLHVAGAGAGPDDGFTGYQPFSAPGTPGRWGDYGAAVALSDGSIWVANEYIPNAPRTLLANWGTFLSHVGTAGY